MLLARGWVKVAFGSHLRSDGSTHPGVEDGPLWPESRSDRWATGGLIAEGPATIVTGPGDNGGSSDRGRKHGTPALSTAATNYLSALGSSR